MVQLSGLMGCENEKTLNSIPLATRQPVGFQCFHWVLRWVQDVGNLQELVSCPGEHLAM